MNIYFKYCDIVSIFDLLDFEIEEVLFKDAKINNNIIIQIITQGRLNWKWKITLNVYNQKE